jgi:hypothetical protein
MMTAIAQMLTLFCTVVVVLAAATWVLTLSRHTPRQVAYRIAGTFGAFRVAAGYVWLDLGPDLEAAPRRTTDRYWPRPTARRETSELRRIRRDAPGAERYVPYSRLGRKVEIAGT